MIQVKPLSLVSTILLIFLSITKPVIASPTNIVSTVPHAPPPQILAYQPSRKPSSPTQSNASTTNNPRLLPRANDFEVLPMSNLNQGWELDFYEFDWGYLPIHSASNILQGFYNRVFELATSSPGLMPAYSVISWGQLDLEIKASQGAVAWASVAAFAAHMLQTARRGYTNSYHCLMMNAAAGVWVSYNLYVSATKELTPPVPKLGN